MGLGGYGGPAIGLDSIHYSPKYQDKVQEGNAAYQSIYLIVTHFLKII
jgi:hypothetical protein